jgi:enoyl-CoA hydratase
MRIVLNRPERHNAIGGGMSQQINDALWEADADQRVYAIVIKGNGRTSVLGRTCGATSPDRDGRSHRYPLYGRRYLADRARPALRHRLLRHPQADDHRGPRPLPGPGTVIAFYCDMVIRADDARVGFPPSRNLGAIPSMMWLYHRGPQWVKRLLLTGDTISGTEPSYMGLALKPVPAAELEARSRGYSTGWR